MDEYQNRIEGNSRFIEETLELFKGQVDYETLFYKWPFKYLDSVRTAREKRLKRENEEMERQMAENKSSQIRNTILKP